MVSLLPCRVISLHLFRGRPCQHLWDFLLGCLHFSEEPFSILEGKGLVTSVLETKWRMRGRRCQHSAFGMHMYILFSATVWTFTWVSRLLQRASDVPSSIITTLNSANVGWLSSSRWERSLAISSETAFHQLGLSPFHLALEALILLNLECFEYWVFCSLNWVFCSINWVSFQLYLELA